MNTNTEKDYQLTKSGIVNTIRYFIKERLNEELTDVYDGDVDAMKNDPDIIDYKFNEWLIECIDQSQYVIYTYYAKQVVDEINIYTPFCESDLSGERFKNWSECAFENIYEYFTHYVDYDDILDSFYRAKKLPKNAS